MVKVSLIWMHDEGFFGLFLFDLWYLFGMDFELIMEFGLYIMLFVCLGVREGFGFEYVLYFRCGLDV